MVKSEQILSGGMPRTRRAAGAARQQQACGRGDETGTPHIRRMRDSQNDLSHRKAPPLRSMPSDVHECWIRR
jgi:hypothetical protein